MDKVLLIVGPTASGKSAVAVEAALRFNGEIISADSMQVYRGMDIGTAKITPDEMEGVPHHLIDICDPNEVWNVQRFQQLCREAIRDIVTRGRLPIVCGGTGLYVKAALYDYGFEPEAPENEAKKAELEAMETPALVELLKERDPGALKKIHPNNRKRLLRAALMSYGSQTKSEREAGQSHQPVYDVHMIGLRVSREQEIARIEQRVDIMFQQGLVEEVRRLFSDPSTRSWNSFQAIGYKEFAGYLDGSQTLDQVREAICIHTRQYARRQMTWFGNQMPVRWFDPSDEKGVMASIEAWVQDNG